MGMALLVLAAVAAGALVAQGVLVALSFRVSTRRGLIALLLPPAAWVLPFFGRDVRRRVRAGIALGCLAACVAFVIDGLHELGHAIDIGGTSVGEPPP